MTPEERAAKVRKLLEAAEAYRAAYLDVNSGHHRWNEAAITLRFAVSNFGDEPIVVEDAPVAGQGGFPPSVKKLIDAVAEWHEQYAGQTMAHCRESEAAKDARVRMQAAFEALDTEEPPAVAEQSDERPRVVQHQYIRENEYTHAAEIILLEDGSVWGRKRRGDGGWERQPLPAAARGGPR